MAEIYKVWELVSIIYLGQRKDSNILKICIVHYLYLFMLKPSFMFYVVINSGFCY